MEGDYAMCVYRVVKVGWEPSPPPLPPYPVMSHVMQGLLHVTTGGGDVGGGGDRGRRIVGHRNVIRCLQWHGDGAFRVWLMEVSLTDYVWDWKGR